MDLECRVIAHDPELEAAQKEVRRLRALVDMLMTRLMEASNAPNYGMLAEEVANGIAMKASYNTMGLGGSASAVPSSATSYLGHPSAGAAHYGSLQSHTFRRLPYPSPTSAGFYVPRSTTTTTTSSSGTSDEQLSAVRSAAGHGHGGSLGQQHPAHGEYTLLGHGGAQGMGDHSSVVDAYLHQAVYGPTSQFNGVAGMEVKDGDILVQSPALRERAGEAYLAGRYY
jgi:hypothetical protein